MNKYICIYIDIPLLYIAFNNDLYNIPGFLRTIISVFGLDIIPEQIKCNNF